MSEHIVKVRKARSGLFFVNALQQAFEQMELFHLS